MAIRQYFVVKQTVDGVAPGQAISLDEGVAAALLDEGLLLPVPKPIEKTAITEPPQTLAIVPTKPRRKRRHE